MQRVYKVQISIICIVANEFCERFSFCGLRTILSIYLRNELMLSENSSTIVYHVFIMGCYIIPTIGAICADSFIGKYRTILYFSLIYLVGNILMCGASVTSIELSKIFFTPFGLLLIALGTGGVKPCVAAFGGDQFYLPDQCEELQHFFSLFYFSINLGGFMGMIITPLLRKNVTCFGEDTCYPLGFGFPAALMLLSIVLFIIGKPWYRLKNPKDNIMLNFMKCASYALVKRMSAKKKKYDHWLDYAQEKYNRKLIDDMKIVFSVLFLFLPVPLFWSLFDQQGSRWTFQASHMNGKVLGLEIVPDQMQVINPAMVLLMIPIMDTCLKPLFTVCPVLQNNLNRMAIGGVAASFAFFSAGILETVLEKTYPELPEKRHASMFIVNTLPCTLKVLNPFGKMMEMNSSELRTFKNLPAHEHHMYRISVEAPRVCGNLFFQKHFFEMTINPVEDQVETVIIGVGDRNRIEIFQTDPIDFKKSLNGRARVRIAYIKTSSSLHNVTISLKNGKGFQDVYFVQDSKNNYLATSAYMELPDGDYNCSINSYEIPELLTRSIELDFGGIYALVIRENRRRIEFFNIYPMAAPNTVSILWLIPQYFFISVAEIFFAIAGLEFAFMQAPKSMKTVTIAGWYLSVAVGNFFVILITQANFFKSQAYEFFLFAILIIADMLVFLEMASRYRFVQLEADSSIYLFRGEKCPLIRGDSAPTYSNDEEEEEEEEVKNVT
ncbi:solute carrier family 15 member 1-like [Harmonia axyridis]|uniref:solute carrier family 15 member 1-like n=1 Tax=Harmonia axyridis TaxID=115357 RepID=UPI001E276FE4|nr:solute carrier family 15 member 1-like [Harmonia axyridis]